MSKCVQAVQPWNVRTSVAVETAVTALSRFQNAPMSRVSVSSVGKHHRNNCYSALASVSKHVMHQTLLSVHDWGST